MRLGKRGAMGVNWMPLWLGCPWSTAISWVCEQKGGMGGGGAGSGGGGGPQVLLGGRRWTHSLVEPAADGGEWDSVVQISRVCMLLCLGELVCVGAGANWLTEWLGDCEEATAIRPALIEFDASLNSFQMEEQVLFFWSNPHCPWCGREVSVRQVACKCVSTCASSGVYQGNCVGFVSLYD